MAHLRIAPEERPAVVALSNLTDSVIEELADGLQNADPSVRSVGKVFAATLGDDNEYLASTLTAMAFLVATTTDVTARVVNDDLKDALGDEAGDADLTPLLESKTLAALSKTIDLRTTHERVLQNFRIVTDIRPVFDKEIGPITSAIVTHSARVTFAVNDRIEEMFVALNHNDLVEIQEAVERALAKEEQSHDFIESRGGHVLDSFKETE
ncbi:hypothetical protein rerp_37390 [Rhodococcus erythropolis]|nr:hypothetical protein rerp_37390 [Rhodococcus erythropolis]